MLGQGNCGNTILQVIPYIVAQMSPLSSVETVLTKSLDRCDFRRKMGQ